MSPHMALRLEELAKTLDHSLLDPRAGAVDVDRACAEAREHHVASVCVLPYWVPRAAEVLRGCDVKVSTVVSYPHGADTTRAKLAAAEQCVADGADELDVVLNTSALLSGEARHVRDELAAIVRAVRVKSVNTGKGIVLVKVVLECGLLDDRLKQLGCKIAEDAGADFVETSTGWREAEATLADVELLRDTLPESIGVKAVGGIDTAEAAEAVVAAGAGRIGTASTTAMMESFPGLRRAS